MSLRVVLYAEGGREVGGERAPRTPGERLEPGDLGPAHLLVRRLIAAERGLPEPAILFEAPLRLQGRVARGGALHERDHLRRLCTWLLRELQPQLVIVLVDADGETARAARLTTYVEGLASAPIIAVARQEFEAWLVADTRAASQVLDCPCSLDGDPEALEPREAKTTLTTWISRAELSDRDVKMSLAATLDLSVLRKRCPSFASFAQRLKAT